VDPGRWNKAGESVLYTATSPALATLETAAHVDVAGLPLNKFLVQIAVPNEVWDRREVLQVSKLGPAWKAVPSGLVSETAGSHWLRSQRCALLLVPSVIVPEEWCVLVNPTHPDARSLHPDVVRPMEYERALPKTIANRLARVSRTKLTSLGAGGAKPEVPFRRSLGGGSERSVGVRLRAGVAVVTGVWGRGPKPEGGAPIRLRRSGRRAEPSVNKTSIRRARSALA
jgi:RES domain-containing protein